MINVEVKVEIVALFSLPTYVFTTFLALTSFFRSTCECFLLISDIFLRKSQVCTHLTPSIPEIIWVKNVRAIVVCGFLIKSLKNIS